jgi:hypothetical protein
MGKNSDGLEKYRQARQAYNSRSLYPGLSKCFHDGKEVLDLVHDWHMEAKKTLRCSDNITPKIVKIIEDEMLHRVSVMRSSTNRLSYQFNTAIEKARKLLVRPRMSRKSSEFRSQPSAVDEASKFEPMY